VADVLLFRLERQRRETLAVLAALLSLPAIVAGAAAQTQSIQGLRDLAQANANPLRCEIRREGVSGAVGLTGVVVSSRRIVGAFRFTATKSGPAGTSNTAQSGRFALDADKEKIVGHIQIGLERDAHVIGELSIRSDDGFECRATAQVGQ
jgi:hypothetical protein